MKRTFPLFLLLFICIAGRSQQEDDSKNISFSVGIRARVTSIYLKKLPGFIIQPDNNILEQPDKHLAGPSFVCAIEKPINKEFAISLSTAFRYSFLYYTLSFNNQNTIGYQQEVKRSLITDIYIDGFKRVVYEKSEIRLGVGLAICGIGSGFTKTIRYLDYNNQSIYVPFKKDFVFPAASASIGWKKHKFLAELKMGYCWANPTLNKNPFLFPELKIGFVCF